MLKHPESVRMCLFYRLIFTFSGFDICVKVNRIKTALQDKGEVVQLYVDLKTSKPKKNPSIDPNLAVCFSTTMKAKSYNTVSFSH